MAQVTGAAARHGRGAGQRRRRQGARRAGGATPSASAAVSQVGIAGRQLRLLRLGLRLLVAGGILAPVLAGPHVQPLDQAPRWGARAHQPVPVRPGILLTHAQPPVQDLHRLAGGRDHAVGQVDGLRGISGIRAIPVRGRGALWRERLPGDVQPGLVITIAEGGSLRHGRAREAAVRRVRPCGELRRGRHLRRGRAGSVAAGREQRQEQSQDRQREGARHRSSPEGGEVAGGVLGRTAEKAVEAERIWNAGPAFLWMHRTHGNNRWRGKQSKGCEGADDHRRMDRTTRTASHPTARAITPSTITPAAARRRAAWPSSSRWVPIRVPIRMEISRAGATYETGVVTSVVRTRM